MEMQYTLDVLITVCILKFHLWSNQNRPRDVGVTKI